MAVNTETLKLYKEDKLYNGSRYQVYLTDKTMEQYLGTPDYQKTVNYKSISEPIEILDPPKNCDEYTYGSITNEDKTYYFFVDYIESDSYKKTYIHYTIDWWSTNWNNIQCTKAHISRQNNSKPLYLEQSISTKNLSITTQPLTNNFCIWATYIPSGEKAPSFINYVILQGTKKDVGFVDEGYWQSVLRIPHADLKDCFVVPYFTPHDLNPALENNIIHVDNENTFYAANSALYTGETHDDKLNAAVQTDLHSAVPKDYIVYDIGDGGYYKVDSRNPYTFHQIYPDKDGKLKRYISNVYYYYDSGIRFEQSEYFHMFSIEDYKVKEFLKPPDYTYRQFEMTPQDLSFTSTEKSKQGVGDWNGNSIWEAPVDSNVTFKIRLTLGLSHIMLEFLPINGNNSQSIVGLSFCYDCRHPGLFVDSYQDYIMKNRDYDVAMRQIQADKEVWTQVGASLEGVGYGYAFGQESGGKAAGIGGVLETVSRYLINQEFNPRIQKQMDLQYARMTDQISLVGDSITNLLNVIDESSGILRRYSIDVSQASSDRYDKDILVNGYYTDESINNLNEIFRTGLIIQADNVVVEGACNVIGKQQVVSRLQRGVEFI